MAKVLPIILAAVVALIIGGAAAWFLKPEPEPEVVAAPPVEKEHHEEHLHEHLIKERIVTLADPGAKRFLKLTIALMWRDLAATPTAKADGGDGEIVFISFSDDDTTGAVDTAPPSGPKGPTLANISEINDIITTTLSSKRVDELVTSDGKERAREELKGKINAALPKTQQVAKVLFTDFIIQ
jgi:flagellar basal body-associated protein FliL